ncbi:MAG: preprotein translocase subunit YajC [Alphaproteobacteria bacterium]|nr:preprotein translocase subunit YajC [Alphaproteobacteria bacterium]
MLITPAYAQAAAGGDLFGSANTSFFLMIGAVFLIMYFLMIRPQQQKSKEHANLVKNIRRGDTVVTQGGMVGKVTRVVDDEQIEIEIADGVRVRWMRPLITTVRGKGEPAREPAKDTPKEPAKDASRDSKKDASKDASK